MKAFIAPHGHIPKRAYPTDAGLDLRAPADAVVPPDRIITIRTGVHIELPPLTTGLVALRSSLGRRGISIPSGLGVIDEGYRGELMIPLYALFYPVYISAGERIAQLLVLPICRPGITSVPTLEELSDTERGQGGFGSTGEV